MYERGGVSEIVLKLNAPASLSYTCLPFLSSIKRKYPAKEGEYPRRTVCGAFNFWHYFRAINEQAKVSKLPTLVSPIFSKLLIPTRGVYPEEGNRTLAELRSLTIWLSIVIYGKEEEGR